MDLICGSLELFAAAIIGILLIGALFKSEHPQPFGDQIIVLLAGHLIGLLCDSLIWFWNPALFPGVPVAVAVALQKITSLIAYSALAGMTVVYNNCLVKYIEEKSPVSKRIVPCVTTVCAVAVGLWIVSGFNGMFFYYDARGMFVATEHYWMTQFTIGVLLCVDVFLILKHHRTIGWRNATPLLVYLLLPMIGFSLSYWLDVTPVYLAATLSMLMMFIVFHLEQDKLLREQERQLTQSRIAIMLTQIQPHFLYNTLTAICGLCDENPKEAKQVTSEFADYLRHNLESLSQSAPVPFEDELRHTQVYLGIEKKRFEEKLNIVYDIAACHFRVPALTIQPLVENAVKHGVTRKKSGGTVTLATREREDAFEIIISDDGRGFDPAQPPDEPDTHIGIENVRERLWAICHGTLEILSEVGKGTVVFVRIPKGKGMR